MAVKGDETGVREAARQWAQRDLSELLSTSAKSIGAGSATDAGRSWRLPTDHPDPIVLAGGIPDAPTLPVDDFRRALDHVLATEPEEALQYGGWLGFEGLREVIAERQSRIEGTELGADNYIIHNGSSGSVDNICKAFIEPGDVVVTEAPSFSGTVRSMRGYGAEIVQAEMDEHGVVVSSIADILARLKREGKRVKFFYTIADFHNPTGVTLTEDRRAELIKLCAEHEVLIVEDAAYTELFFGDAPPPSIYSMAEGQGVMRLGSLSKNIATGLRVGWVQALPAYIDALSRVRFDMGNSPLVHRALADYIGSGKLDAHIEKMRPIYAEKCEILVESLLEYCEPYIRFKKPDGGFFLWVDCLGASAKDVAKAAADEGLVCPLGVNFFSDRENSNDNHLRMAFSAAPLEQLAEAGPRLRAAFLKVVD
ncbi:MAG: PLP-dependent aminotransferase family protein [Chloroflexi bacterium]|nr:PLP-dependent aminotransferase family protein [Chloroflexota bacterium]